MQNELLKQIIIDLKLTKDTADDTEGSNICAAKEPCHNSQGSSFIRSLKQLDKCLFVVSNILDSGMSAKPRTKDCQVWI
jgi:hypothetical protein